MSDNYSSSSQDYIYSWQTFSPYYTKNYIKEKLIRETIPLESSNFRPQNNKIYSYNLVGNQTFVFNNDEFYCNFRLYLIMPAQIVQFEFPTNIIWDSQPDLSSANSLYMFVFQWNPILNKWLGNQMLDVTELSTDGFDSSSSSDVSN